MTKCPGHQIDQQYHQRSQPQDLDCHDEPDQVLGEKPGGGESDGIVGRPQGTHEAVSSQGKEAEHQEDTTAGEPERPDNHKQQTSQQKEDSYCHGLVLDSLEQCCVDDQEDGLHDLYNRSVVNSSILEGGE